MNGRVVTYKKDGGESVIRGSEGPQEIVWIGVVEIPFPRYIDRDPETQERATNRLGRGKGSGGR